MFFDFAKTLVLLIILLCGFEVLVVAVPSAVYFILCGLVVAALWALFYEPNRLIVKSHSISLPDWPSECNGMKIAVLGCLHAGAPFVDIKKLQRIVSLINDQHADAIFLLGDFVGTYVLGGRPLTPEAVAGELQALGCPQKKFAVLGNHDLWHGKERTTLALESAGIVVLNNTCVSMTHGSGREIFIAGVAFDGDQREATAKTFHDAPTNVPILALVHSPDTFPMVPVNVMLTCASHTHGGQIRLPLIGALLVPCKTGTRYASGLFNERGRQLVVTNGIGTSLLAARFFCPPEVLVLSLSRAANRTSGYLYSTIHCLASLSWFLSYALTCG